MYFTTKDDFIFRSFLYFRPDKKTKPLLTDVRTSPKSEQSPLYLQGVRSYLVWKGVQMHILLHFISWGKCVAWLDFAGEKLSFFDKAIKETKPVEVFVAILGASQLTFVQAVTSQQKEDFIGACEDALHYYGGVPAAIVPDNLRSAVTKSNKYEPTINETFSDFAEHYNTTILPARAYKPKDKALVESAVNIIYTRIYAKIRNVTFF